MSEKTKNSITTVGFDFPTDGNWTYESNDGGKTIYRREYNDSPPPMDMKEIEEKAPFIAEIMKEYNDNTEVPSESQIDSLRQKLLNLEMANAELKDMLRDKGVDVI